MPDGSPTAAKTIWNIVLKQPFEVAGLNTSMTQHHSTLVADPATDLIVHPMSDELRQSPGDPLALAKAGRAVDLFWRLFQSVLAKHGHAVFLDRIEHDPDIGWLIHYRVRDAITVTMLHDIAAGEPGPSDPAELSLFISQASVRESHSV
jgi:hypothetical protein